MHAEYRVCVKKSNIMDVIVNKTQVSIEETVVQRSEDEMNIRKGLWSVEEDTILANYVTTHDHGCWNSVAPNTGLKRSGKSCRLRWLNYLRPGVRHGNITLQEQIMILDLHSQWGNRWSKIAQHLPGRTDNEIKNYWRTRVKKQAKQLNCDVDSKRFKDALRYMWMPLLIERAHPPSAHVSSSQLSPSQTHVHHQNGLDNSGSSSLDSINNINSSDSSSREELQFHDSNFNSGYCVSPKHLGHTVGLNNQMLQEENGNLPCGDDDDGDDLLERLLNNENIGLLQQLCDDLVINDDYFLV